MKIPTDRNIAFKVSNDTEFKYLKKILNNDDRYFDYKHYEWYSFGNDPIWIYERSNSYPYGFDVIKDVPNPKLEYSLYNYLIIDVKNLMRKEKLKRIQ